MFSWKKIAAASGLGLLSGLAVTCAGAGAAQAFDGGTSTICTLDIQGNSTCAQRSPAHTSEDGRYSVNQSQDCLATKPVSFPAGGLLNNGSTAIGPAVNCSNTAPQAKDFNPPSMAP